MSSLFSRFRGSNSTATAAREDQLSSAALPSANNDQTGIVKVEAIASSWSKTGLAIAYVGIFLGSIMYALEVMTTFAYIPAATSAFQLHSALSTLSVVTNVLYATVKPPMAKIADAFGRTEAFILSLLLAVIGYVMEAACKDMETYAASRIFGAAGTTGITILIQIFIADTTSLLNRALFSSLPDVPYIFTVWAGPALAAAVGPQTNWRWGFGMWAIVYPIAFLPLIWSLVANQFKAKRMGLLPSKTYSGLSLSTVKQVAIDLDLIGLVLFTGGLIMFLVPLTLGSGWGWSDGRTVSLLVIGILTLIAFVVIESIPAITPKPMMSWDMLGDRTVGCACGLGFFYFFVYYLPGPYFYSWMQVVRGLSVKASGNVSNIFTLSSCITSIIISLLIKYTGRYKLLMMSGIPIYVLGYGLMIKFRSSEATMSQIIFAQILTGVGGGTINVPAQLGLQAACGHGNVAVATAMFLTMANIGGAVGSAVSGAIWSNLLPSKLASRLEGMPAAANASLIYANYFEAMSFPMGSPERIEINNAYEEVFKIQLIAACCLSVPMIFLGLAMKGIDLNAVNLHNVKGMVIGNVSDHASDTTLVTPTTKDEENTSYEKRSDEKI